MTEPEPESLEDALERLKNPRQVGAIRTELEVLLTLDGAGSAALVLLVADGPEAPDSDALAELWNARAREAMAQDVKDTTGRGRVRALFQALLVYAKADESAGAAWGTWPVALWWVPRVEGYGVQPTHRVWARYSIEEQDLDVDEGPTG